MKNVVYPVEICDTLKDVLRGSGQMTGLSLKINQTKHPVHRVFYTLSKGGLEIKVQTHNGEIDPCMRKSPPDPNDHDPFLRF